MICITYQLSLKKGLTFVTSSKAAPGRTNPIFPPSRIFRNLSKMQILDSLSNPVKLVYLENLLISGENGYHSSLKDKG